MHKLLVVVCIWSLIFSSFVWAEDGDTLTDTAVVLETVVDASVVAEVAEQTQNPIDRLALEGEKTETNLSDDVSVSGVTPTSEEIHVYTSAITTVSDEVVGKETVDVTMDASVGSVSDDFSEPQSIYSILSLPQEESEEVVVSDTNMRIITINNNYVTISRK